MQSSMVLQQLTHLPSLALRQMRIIGQDLKNRLADIWQRVSESFRKTDLWKISIQPWYNRHLKPLGKLDVLVLTGSLAATLLITLLAIQLFGIAALPLGIAVGATGVGLAYSLTRRRVEYHFEKEARKEVEKIRAAVNEITHADRTFAAVQAARELLRKPEFEHLSKDWEELDRQLGQLKVIVLSDNPAKTKENLEENKKSIFAYLEGLLRKLDPHQAVNPLAGFVRVGNHIN